MKKKIGKRNQEERIKKIKMRVLKEKKESVDY